MAPNDGLRELWANRKLTSSVAAYFSVGKRKWSMGATRWDHDVSSWVPPWTRS